MNLNRYIKHNLKIQSVKRIIRPMETNYIDHKIYMKIHDIVGINVSNIVHSNLNFQILTHSPKYSKRKLSKKFKSNILKAFI